MNSGMLCKESRSSPMGSAGVPVLISCLALGTLKVRWSCVKERSFSDAALLGGKVLVRMYAFMPLLAEVHMSL